MIPHSRCERGGALRSECGNEPRLGIAGNRSLGENDSATLRNSGSMAGRAQFSLGPCVRSRRPPVATIMWRSGGAT